MPPKGKGNTTLAASDIDTDNVSFTSESVILLIDKLTVNFTSSFNLCVDRIVTAIEKKFEHRIECQETEIFNLHKKLDSLEKQNKNLETANCQLQEKINCLTTKVDTVTTAIDDLEQYSRNSNLLIQGIPSLSTSGGSEENLTDHVIQLLNSHLGTSILTTDVSAVHRLGKPHLPAREGAGTADQNSSSPTHTVRPSPVIIQFSNKNIRNMTLGQRRRLKGKSIAITEHLTARRASILKKGTELVTSKKIEGAWSHDGKILVKTFNHRTLVINNEHELMSY